MFSSMQTQLDIIPGKKPEYAKDLKWSFEEWVNDYQYYIDVTGNYGWYEIKASEHIKGYTEQIRTN